MAKAEKRPPPPTSSEEDSSSDDEQQPTTATKPVVPQTQTREESESESSSESSEDEDEEVPESRPVNNASEKPQPSTSKPTAESESESESESEPGDSEPPKLVTPINADEDEEIPEPASRPVNNASEKSQPSTSKSTAESESESESDGDSEPPKLVSPITSRSMAAAAPKDSNAEKSNGKPLFQRIWALEDEITLLKGMIQFQSERGPIKPSIAGIEDFHAFIQSKLSLEVVSKNQLLAKIKKLKDKYLAAAARDKSGLPHKFQKTHYESIYELGKIIWFSDDDVRRSKRNFPFLKAVAESMKTKFAEEKLVKIDQAKTEMLEKRFKRQKLVEMKHHLRGMDLWKETFKLIMEGVERATG